jgi:hypothetical protein
LLEESQRFKNLNIYELLLPEVVIENVKNKIVFDISGSHDDEYEYNSFLVYSAL